MNNKEIAQKWAEDYLNSEEGLKYSRILDEEFKNFFLFGKATVNLNSEAVRDICEYDGVMKVEELPVEQIIEKFGDLITEKDIENLNKMRDGNNLDL